MLNFLLGSLVTGLSIYAGILVGQKIATHDPVPLPHIELPKSRAKGRIVRNTPEREAQLREQE